MRGESGRGEGRGVFCIAVTVHQRAGVFKDCRWQSGPAQALPSQVTKFANRVMPAAWLFSG